MKAVRDVVTTINAIELKGYAREPNEEDLDTLRDCFGLDAFEDGHAHIVLVVVQVQTARGAGTLNCGEIILPDSDMSRYARRKLTDNADQIEAALARQTLDDVQGFAEVATLMAAAILDTPDNAVRVGFNPTFH